MKHLFIMFLLVLSLYGMAQTNPRTQTPQQLAEQMTTSIAQSVTLDATQQAQLTAAATQYFTNLRNMSQSAPEERAQLYQSFQQTLQTILTAEKYEQWQQAIAAHREQLTQSAPQD